MAGRFSLGITLTEAQTHDYVINGRTPAQLLAMLDNLNDDAADVFGYAHGSPQAYSLYPGMYTIAAGISHLSADHPAPTGSAFPELVLMDGLRDRGVVPIIWFGPNGNGHVNDNPAQPADGSIVYARFKNWADGLYDDMQHDWREAAVDWAHNANSTGFSRRGNAKSNAIIVRFAQEMNATWWNWSLSKYENSTYWKPAWQRLYGIIKGNLVPAGHEKATFVSLFYCPWDERKTGALTHSFAQAYPGDAYVDFVGTDIYQLTNPAQALSLCYEPNFKNFLAVTDKPILIGESNTIDPPSNIYNWLQLKDNNPAAAAGGVVWTHLNHPEFRGLQYFGISPELRTPARSSPYMYFLGMFDPATVDIMDEYVKSRGVSTGGIGLGGTGKSAPHSVSGYIGLGGVLGTFKPKVTLSLTGSVGIHGTSVPFRTGAGFGSIGITGTGAEHIGDESDLYLFEGEGYDDIEAIYENNLP